MRTLTISVAIFSDLSGGKPKTGNVLVILLLFFNKCHLVMTNIANWKWTIEIDVLPIKIVIFNSKLLVYQRVYQVEEPPKYCPIEASGVSGCAAIFVSWGWKSMSPEARGSREGRYLVI